MTWIRIWIRIHFFQCGSRIRIRIKIKWILSTGLSVEAISKYTILNLNNNDFNEQNITCFKKLDLFSLKQLSFLQVENIKMLQKVTKTINFDFKSKIFISLFQSTQDKTVNILQRQTETIYKTRYIECVCKYKNYFRKYYLQLFVH